MPDCGRRGSPSSAHAAPTPHPAPSRLVGRLRMDGPLFLMGQLGRGMAMGRKRGIPGLSFSWKRAMGLSAAKGRLSRQLGIPLSRQGRQRKVGAALGCCAPFLGIVLGGGIAVLLGLSAAGQAFAHSGGLDKNGCHTNRKTGEYHCHRGPAAAQPGLPLEARSTPLGPKAGEDVYYANCAAARAAGAAPVRRGDPGYSSRLDRDGDGIGCE